MQDFIDALSRYNKAAERMRLAVDSCEHDPSYFCYREIQEAEKAQAELVGKLNNLIDQRVKIVLKDLGIAIPVENKIDFDDG